MSKTIYSALLVAIFSALNPFISLAQAGESVNGWAGVVDDLNGYHDPKHLGDHPLKFTRSSDGESFLIVEGDEGLLQEHLASDKSLLVEIDGRITSKFLFFGGNLVIKEAKAVRELAQVEHRKVFTRPDSDRPHGSMGRERR